MQSYLLPNDGLCFNVLNNIIYVADFEGLYVYKEFNNKLILQYSVPYSSGISSIIPSKGEILIGSYGGGIVKIENKKRKKESIEKFPISNVEKLVKLKNGYAAFSFEEGFFMIDDALIKATLFTTKEGLLSNYVTTAINYYDSLAIASKHGIQFIYNNRVVKKISYEKGFKGKTAKQLLVDKNQKLFVISDKSIMVYDNGLLRPIASQQLFLIDDEEIKDANFIGDNKIIVATNKKLTLIELEDNGLNLENNYSTKIINCTLNGSENIYLSELNFPFDYKKIVFKLLPLENYVLKEKTIFYKLNEGDWVRVEDSLSIVLSNLSPGRYNLYTKIGFSNGAETIQKFQTSFEIKRVWWQQNLFLLLWGILAIAAIWYLVTYINKRKYEKQLQALKLQEELEVERQRISRDLHDNMGAYTSALIANVQQLKTTIGETEQTNKMQVNAESILNSLRETIWVLNNKEIHLKDFNDGFKNYCFKVLKNFDEINFNVEENIESNPILKATQAIHLNKILQEVTQNCIKHAKCSSIIYKIDDSNGLQISLSDNGVGFENAYSKGFGIDNMKWRAKEASLDIRINSRIKNGTTIEINTLK